MDNDYYKILGINHNSSADDIKKAYRKAALKYHPDKNKSSDAEKKFKEASEAYSILSDPHKKAQYDQFGQVGNFSYNQSHSSNPFDIFNSFFSDYGSNFNNSFFTGTTNQPRYNGRHLQIDITISLGEAYRGTKKEITFSRNEICTKCKGEGGDTKVCSACSGQGQVKQRLNQMMISIVTCPKCHGSGSVISKKCSKCAGRKVVVQRRNIKVDIPPGIEDKAIIKIHGEGEQTHIRSSRGDLLCCIQVRPHNYFMRNGVHLICKKNITITQACLGTTLLINTIDDKKANLKIPPGTQNDSTFCMNGLGFPQSHNSKNRGNQYIKINVEIPKNLNEKQKQLLEELEKSF